jgi:phage-related protein
MVSNFLGQFNLMGSAVTSLVANFSTLTPAVSGALVGVTALLSPFVATFTTSFTTPLTTALNAIFGAGGLLGLGFVMNIQSIFGEGGLIPTAIMSLNTSLLMLPQGFNLVSGAIGDAFNRISGAVSRATTIAQIALDNLKGAITTFASDMGLGQVATTLKTQLVDAFVNAVNSVISALNSAINNAISPFMGIPGVGDVLRGLGVPVSIGAIGVPGNAKGAMGVKGLRMVGEKGPELIAPKSPVNIFPSNLSRAILAQGNSGFLQGAMPSSYTNNNTTNVNNTFNVGSENQALLLQRQQQAYLGY